MARPHQLCCGGPSFVPAGLRPQATILLATAVRNRDLLHQPGKPRADRAPDEWPLFAVAGLQAVGRP
jgi:hypothetical protein